MQSGSDSCWQWLVCAFAFVAQFLLGGFANCGGVIYATVVDEFNSSRGDAGTNNVTRINIELDS